jgi:hypothetical protein
MQLLFSLGISKPLSLRTGLILPYMLGLDVISFSISTSPKRRSELVMGITSSW